ncbi:MAG: dynamin family protein [Stigonema ocellatum SAG 48.90 = DSM 106950]|nr:dynamin family protein [Stigonema ocellatum SAG 48.90 = DSM 106950]
MTQTKTHHQYEAFQKKNYTLASLIQRQLAILDSLEMKAWFETLNRLAERVQAENFKVLVLGEFKRGKSTFINAMLGEEVLPAKAPPCTAIINEVKWGAQRQAVLHYAKSEDGSVKPPIPIPVEQIKDYVVIKHDQSEIRSNPYEKVELFWPLELCRNGVEIIDSPGLNEHDIRQKVTIDYLSSVDAILFVLSCEALAAKSELEVIENNLKPAGHEDIFFICNRFDLIRPREREELKQYGISRLAPHTKRKAEGVFFVSALDALDGRLDGDNERVNQSGISQLEHELEKFLATEKGRVKILRPAQEVKSAIREARRIIPEREALLRMDLQTLEARYADAQEPLRQLEALRQQIVDRVSNFRSEVKLLVSQQARVLYRSITSDKIDKYDNKIAKWVQEYQLKEPVTLQDALKLGAAIERVVKELTENISSQLEGEFANWQTSELQPLLSNRLEDLTKDLNARASVFVSQIDDLRVQVSGTPTSVQVDIGRVSPLSRILAVAGGYLMGDLVSAGLGAVFGIKEMLVNLVQQITLAAVTIFFVGINPWILVPVMLGGGLVHGLIKVNATNDQIKKAFIQKYVEELRQSSYERSDEIANAVAEKLLKFQNAIDEGLGKEIQSVRDQVNSILAEKQKGQANVDQKIRDLASISKDLNAIDSELDALINQVALL